MGTFVAKTYYPTMIALEFCQRTIMQPNGPNAFFFLRPQRNDGKEFRYHLLTTIG